MIKKKLKHLSKECKYVFSTFLSSDLQFAYDACTVYFDKQKNILGN